MPGCPVVLVVLVVLSLFFLFCCVAFPLTQQGRHSQRVISELNTSLHIPLSTLTLPLRTAAHDSGLRQGATPYRTADLHRLIYRQLSQALWVSWIRFSA